MKRFSRLALCVVGVALACAEPGTSPDQDGTTRPQFASATTGSWHLFPGQSTTYQTSVQQPINADGSSNFQANGRGVIPVKFSLATGTGPARFESIGSDVSTSNDFFHLGFVASPALTFADIATLSAVYAFTLGDCHGGSLRWQIKTALGTVFIYYGLPPQVGNDGTGGCTATSPGGQDQSGVNMIGNAALQYDTGQYPGGTYYDNYAHAAELLGSTPLTEVALVLDSGWGGDQRLTLTSATVNDNTYTPAPASPVATTCDLPTATIKITKVDGASSGLVNEPLTIQPSDDNSLFRQVDCKYAYNLATSSLSGAGRYTVSAVVGGHQASGEASFDLR
jgi:hypothetical protein